MTDLKDFENNISKITAEQWQQLFDLIPVLSKTKVFAKSSGMKENSDGYLLFPHLINSEVVSEFQNLVYEIGLVNSFDWPSWEEGKQLLNDSAADFNKLDIKTLCMLITAIVRNDRFCDGSLVSFFENGTILKILKALKEKVNY
jgi:hypothetical protein